MPPAYPFFALALAAALFDVTLGFPRGLARRIGAPSQWLDAWLRIVREAGASWSGPATLTLYLAPILVAGAAVAAALPEGPFGFAATALLASLFCGRQTLDARASRLLQLWEDEGAQAALARAETLDARERERSLARALPSALADRFADEVLAPTLWLLLAGLPGAALARALAVAARAAEARRDAFGEAAAALQRRALQPAAWLAALWLALAAGRPALMAREPAAVMLRALGDPLREHPAALRRALSLYRRAAALEMATLAALALFSAFLL